MSRLRRWVSTLNGGQLLVLLALELAAAFLLAAAAAAVAFHAALGAPSTVGIPSLAAEALSIALAPQLHVEIDLMVGAAFWTVFVVFGVGIGLLTLWWWFGARAKPWGSA